MASRSCLAFVLLPSHSCLCCLAPDGRGTLLISILLSLFIPSFGMGWDGLIRPPDGRTDPLLFSARDVPVLGYPPRICWRTDALVKTTGRTVYLRLRLTDLSVDRLLGLRYTSFIPPPTSLSNTTHHTYCLLAIINRHLVWTFITFIHDTLMSPSSSSPRGRGRPLIHLTWE